jgi:hypothetical protein
MNQYTETNAIYFSFSSLRIKGLYMVPALLAHTQEAFTNGIWYIAFLKLQPCHSQLTLYARNIPNAVCVAPPEDEKVMHETCRGL